MKMSEFKWKIATFLHGHEKHYSRQLIDNLDNTLRIAAEAARYNLIDSITINYTDDITVQYEIHRKVEVQ
jgi:hypothetical protein